jgi:hypothetical protein
VKYKNLILYLIIIFFLIILYLMGPSGVDWPAYKSIRIDFSRPYFFREPLGWLLPYLLRNFNNGNFLAGAIISIILIFGTLKLLNTISSNYTINICIIFVLIFSNFFLLLSVNGLRQGVALGFLIYGIRFSLIGRSTTSFIFLTLAILSHNSAILLLPIFLFQILKINNALKIISILPIIILGPSINSIAVKNNLLSVTNNSKSFLLLSCLCFYFTVVLFFKQGSEVKYRNFIIGFYLFVAGIAFYPINSAYERLVYYLIPLQLIFVTPVIDYFNPKKLIYPLLILIAIISILYSLSHPSVQNNFLGL